MPPLTSTTTERVSELQQRIDQMRIEIDEARERLRQNSMPRNQSAEQLDALLRNGATVDLGAAQDATRNLAERMQQQEVRPAISVPPGTIVGTPSTDRNTISNTIQTRDGSIRFLQRLSHYGHDAAGRIMSVAGPVVLNLSPIIIGEAIMLGEYSRDGVTVRWNNERQAYWLNNPPGRLYGMNELDDPTRDYTAHILAMLGQATVTGNLTFSNMPQDSPTPPPEKKIMPAPSVGTVRQRRQIIRRNTTE